MTMSNNNQDYHDALNTVFCKVDAALDALNGIVALRHTLAGVGVSPDGKYNDDLYSLFVKADYALTELHYRVRLRSMVNVHLSNVQ